MSVAGIILVVLSSILILINLIFWAFLIWFEFGLGELIERINDWLKQLFSKKEKKMNYERKPDWFYCDQCMNSTPENKLHLVEGKIYCDKCFEELFGKEF